MTTESTDIMNKGPLDYYAIRPVILESLSLSEFVANYNVRKKLKRVVNPTTADASADDNEVLDSHSLKLTDGSAFVIKRKRPKVIRFRRYCKVKDPTNYFREKVMLFKPWRDERQELLNADNESKYYANIESITQIEKQFVFNLETD